MKSYQNLQKICAKEIRRLANSSTLSKGDDYYRNGNIKEILLIGNRANATVAGQRKYTVKILAENSKPLSECTCPVDGFCKHIAAVFLALANDKNITYIDERSLKAYLLGKSPDELVNMILDHGASHPTFLKTLAVDSHIVSRSYDISFFKQRIDDMLDIAYEIDYFDTRKYVQELKTLQKQLALLIGKSPRDAAQLFLYFVRRSVDVFEESGIDDSDGIFGSFIIDLGKPLAASVEKSGFVMSAAELCETYFKSADYGVEDWFEPVMSALPDTTLKDLESEAMKRFEKAKDPSAPWKAGTEAHFLASILARRDKKEESKAVRIAYQRMINEFKARRKGVIR